MLPGDVGEEMMDEPSQRGALFKKELELEGAGVTRFGWGLSSADVLLLRCFKKRQYWRPRY